MNKIIEALKKHNGNCEEVEKNIYLRICNGKKDELQQALNWCYENKGLFIGYLNQIIQEYDFTKNLSDDLEEVIEEKVKDQLEEWEEGGECVNKIQEYGSYSYTDEDKDQAVQVIKDDALEDVEQFNYDYEFFGENDDDVHYDNKIKHLEKLLTYLY